jgi:hypothetical protein
MSRDFSRRRLVRFAASGGLAALLPSCATPERGQSVPMGQASQATVLGLPNECFFPATGVERLEAEFIAAVQRMRRPTLTWPRQIPVEGEPADVHAIATEYADWLETSNVPKLFLKAEPGAILANDRLVNLVRGWPALTEKTVAGIHFVQEDSPDEIGRAVGEWMGTLG